jgi:phenylpyruvate tautomerase PptA (4-oxalocrotonate tautomerase family)
MSERLWGHDAIRIEMPYAVAKILVNPDNGDQPALIADISEAVARMLANSSLLEPSPIAVVLDGVLADGDDVTVGPCVYIRKVFMDDVERLHATLKGELDL